MRGREWKFERSWSTNKAIQISFGWKKSCSWLNSRVDFILFFRFFSAFCGFYWEISYTLRLQLDRCSRSKQGLIFFFQEGERSVQLATYSNEPELCGVGVVQSSISDTQRLEPTAVDDDDGWWTFSKGTVKKRQQQAGKTHKQLAAAAEERNGRKNQLKQQRTEQATVLRFCWTIISLLAWLDFPLLSRLTFSCLRRWSRGGRCFCSRFRFQAAAGWSTKKSFFRWNSKDSNLICLCFALKN